MATDKAWSAVTFRTNTAELDRVTQPGMPQSGIRNRPRVVAVAGGMVNVSGSRIAMPLAPPRPGSTPISTPSVSPTAVIRPSFSLPTAAS